LMTPQDFGWGPFTVLLAEALVPVVSPPVRALSWFFTVRQPPVAPIRTTISSCREPKENNRLLDVRPPLVGRRRRGRLGRAAPSAQGIEVRGDVACLGLAHTERGHGGAGLNGLRAHDPLDQ